jgi:hypothetical protein
VRDFDLFIDYCREVSLEDVVVVKPHDRKGLAGALRGYDSLVPAEILGGNRTRLDIFRWLKDVGSVWGAHEGHEFVHVLNGILMCEFGLDDTAERKQYKLAKGDGIAFPSMLKHRFWNPGPKRVEFAVARPTGSVPGKTEYQ